MIYYIITIINIYGAFVSIACIYLVLQNYHISKYMQNFALLKMGSMLYMLFVNIYNLDAAEREWKIPITSLLWIATSLYFSWAVRFSGIKKC